MKYMTKNLVSFMIGFIFTTLLFRYGISQMLQNQIDLGVWFMSALYAIVNLILGLVFGKKDTATLPLYDIGFRFHLAAYLIYNIITELWYLSGFQAQREQIKAVHIIALLWGIALLIHLVFYLATRKNAIKGIRKSEIFD